MNQTNGIKLRSKITRGFSTFFILYIIPILLHAQQDLMKIPVTLKPEDGIYKFSLEGKQLNSLISPLKIKRLIANKSEEISFQKDTYQHTIKQRSIPGIIKSSDLTQSGLLYLVAGWEIELINLNHAKAFIFSKDSVNLEPVEGTQLYKLPSDSNFTIEIHETNIRANLVLHPNSDPQTNNPINLIQQQAPARGVVNYQIMEEAGTLDGRSKINVLVLSGDAEKVLSVISMDVKSRENSQGMWGATRLPDFDKIGEKRDFTNQVKIVTLVTHENGDYILKLDNLKVTRKSIGIFFGLLTLFLLLGLIWFLKDVPFSKKKDEVRYNIWKKKGYLERLIRFPFHFAVTPLGRYSISLAQILFWTFIVLFAFVYIFVTRGESLHITGQILTLLGISAATAITAKIAATTRLREIPEEFFEDVSRDRLPHFSDLFSIGDSPNIFKFQIFSFTLLAGIYVIRELLRTGTFPLLEENILTLMGISGGIYIANELASENVWKKLEGLISEIKKKQKELNSLDEKVLTAESDKLKNILKDKDIVDKDLQDKIRKRITEIQESLVKQKYRDDLNNEIETLKNQVNSELKKIYSD